MPFGFFVFLALLAALSGPLALVLLIATRGRTRHNEEDIERLRTRLELLASRFSKDHRATPDLPAPGVPAPRPAAAAVQPPAGAAPHPTITAPQPAVAAPQPEKPTTVPPRYAPVPHSKPAEHQPVDLWPVEPETPRPAAPTRASTTTPRGAKAIPAQRREIGSWEDAIGGSWLNRIGVALLVIGIAFALAYSFTRLGPAGKAALANAVSLAMSRIASMVAV